MIRLAVFALTLTNMIAGAASGAVAQEPAASATTNDPDTEEPHDVVLTGDQGFAVALQLFIRAGQHQDALNLLESRPDLASRADAKRLRAQLLLELRREREAIALLEAHLTEDRRDAIARFQLAEAHFAARRDGAASLAYRLALAGELDEMRISMSNMRLAEIQDRRRWRTWAGASVAPDSNLNSATDAARVELFGLPFELNDEARRRSGVAATVFGGVERRVRFSGDFAARVGLVGSATDAPGATFDDAYLSLRAGPEWRIGDGLVVVQATSGRRWFGGDPYEVSAGLLTEFEAPQGPNVRWAGSMRAEQSDSQVNEARDGWSYGLDANRTRYLGPSSLWRLNAVVAYREAKAAPETFTQAQLGIGRLYALPFATLVYVEPYILGRWYEGASAAFGVAREDQEFGAAARISKRDWVFAGAFPFVSISAARNESNIALNDFSRERIEFGFTREF